MNEDTNPLPKPRARTGRQALFWLGAGCIIVAVIGVLAYTGTAPPTPSEAAEQYIEDHYDKVAEAVTHTVFPDSPLKAEITAEVAESIAEQVIPYNCRETGNTGNTVDTRCNLSLSLNRPLEVRIEAPFRVSISTTNRDVFNRTIPVVQDSTPITGEMTLNGVSLEHFKEAQAAGQQFRELLNAGWTAPGRPTPQTKPSTRIPKDDENRRRCRFWALNNLRPIVFQEFSALNPATMDDLDRILWRSILHPEDRLGFYNRHEAGGDETPSLWPREPGIHCRDYWAEPLGPHNASLRNHSFETQCRTDLEKHITSRYRHLADTATSNKDNDLVWETPNQHVRILQWLDTSGQELLDSRRPPHVILHEQSKYPHAHMSDTIPDDNLLADYRKQWDREPDLEWLGILRAADMTHNSSSGLSACQAFYPQVFYGHWIPFEPDYVTTHRDSQQANLVKYNPSTMPIRLPERIHAPRVRAGYPLGMTGEKYHSCTGQTEAQQAGYYYVDHPTGAYCERAP